MAIFNGKFIVIFTFVLFWTSVTLFAASSVEQLPPRKPEARGLPDCSSTYDEDTRGRPPTVIVSTLDGKLTALEWTEGDWKEKWSKAFGGDSPLITSTVDYVSFYQRGIPNRLIPSLGGQLFAYDGQNMEPLPVTADTLLKSSYKMGDDVLVSGRKESRSFGIRLSTGSIDYECGFEGCHRDKSENDSASGDDMLLVERFIQGIRAHDPRDGNERWNMFTSEYKISLLSQEADCKFPPVGDAPDSGSDFTVRLILPSSEIEVTDGKHGLIRWRKKFNVPIANVWLIKDGLLTTLDPFSTATTPGIIDSLDPILFLGHYSQSNQLYIQTSQSSPVSLTSIQVPPPNDEQKLVGFKPTKSTRPANELVSVETDLLDVTSAGLFLYHENDQKKCSANDSSRTINVANTSSFQGENNSTEESLNEIIIVSLWYWWREVLGLSIVIAVAINVVFTYLNKQVQECISGQPSPEPSTGERDSGLPLSLSSDSPMRPGSISIVKGDVFQHRYSKSTSNSSTVTPSSPPASLSDEGEYQSHFLKEFENIQCLGKGGFGVVFEAMRKFDGRSYAIKRIRVPSRPEAKEKVMREVKALANLDHSHIVRYFYSWVEVPPFGWQEEKDKELLSNLTQASNLNSTLQTSTSPLRPQFCEDERKRQLNASSVFEDQLLDEESVGRGNVTSDSQDSYVVFENSSQQITSKVAQENVSEKEEGKGNESMEDSSLPPPQPIRPTTLQFSPSLQKTFLYIQMELCEKYTLREWLQRNQPHRPKEEVMDIFRQITQAVEYVHASGLMHRDLKPSNIFFSLDGVVKVGDFGLVTAAVSDSSVRTPNSSEVDLTLLEKKTVNSPNGQGSHTNNVGTSLYMSPEQMKGLSYSNKVDVFSLGVIFFELLYPFPTEMERTKTLLGVREHKFPKQFIRDHPEESKLSKKLLAHEPDERPSAIQMLEDPLLVQRKTLTVPVTLRRRTISVTDTGDVEDPLTGNEGNNM